MGTMIYTPGIRVHIQTAGHGIVDVSDDLESGSLTLAEKQPSQFSFSLTNYRRKYDGVFTPNDTISVQMKRIRWFPVFAGYLNQVPYFSVYPRSIQLTATDSLKRLQYRFWDPGAEASVNLLNGLTLTPDKSRAEKTTTDGGLRDILMELLQKVGDWPASHMHIGRIPDDWSNKMAQLEDSVGSQIAVDTGKLGLDGATYGLAAGALGSTTDPSGSTANSSGANRVILRTGASTTDDFSKGISIVPVTRGKVATCSTEGVALLTGERYDAPSDPYFCDMQFGFGDPSSSGSTPGDGFSAAEYASAKKWWANRHLLLTSPKTGQSVVVRAVGWGPEPFSDAKVAASSRALRAIGAKEGDTLKIGFAPIGSRSGPVKQPERTPSLDLFFTPEPTTPDVIKGSSGEGTGDRITTPENLQSNVLAARTFIEANWNLPYGIGGYSPRSASGSSVEADHYRGLALDVVVCEPGTQATGTELLVGNAIAEWFANNAVVHGANYVIWQDLINYGNGWSTYGRPSSNDDTEQHRDHVHISFHGPVSLLPGDPATYLSDPYDDPSFNGIQ